MLFLAFWGLILPKTDQRDFYVTKGTFPGVRGLFRYRGLFRGTFPLLKTHCSGDFSVYE